MEIYVLVKIKMNSLYHTSYLIDTNVPGGFHLIHDVMTEQPPFFFFYLANWSRPPPSPPHTDTHVVFFNLSPGELNFRVALLKAVIKPRQWSLKTCCPTAPHVMSAFRGLIQATTSHKRVNSCSQRTLGKHAWLALKQKPGCL